MKQLNRPLSPHLSLYKPQLTSILSIFHRISGTVLALVFLITSLCINLIFSFLSYTFVYYLYFFIIIFVYIILSILLTTFFFHILNGIRHISWDLGLGLDLNNLVSTGFFVLTITALLTLVFMFL